MSYIFCETSEDGKYTMRKGSGGLRKKQKGEDSVCDILQSMESSFNDILRL